MLFIKYDFDVINAKIKEPTNSQSGVIDLVNIIMIGSENKRHCLAKTEDSRARDPEIMVRIKDTLSR